MCKKKRDLLKDIETMERSLKCVTMENIKPELDASSGPPGKGGGAKPASRPLNASS